MSKFEHVKNSNLSKKTTRQNFKSVKMKTEKRNIEKKSLNFKNK